MLFIIIILSAIHNDIHEELIVCLCTVTIFIAIACTCRYASCILQDKSIHYCGLSKAALHTDCHAYAYILLAKSVPLKMWFIFYGPTCTMCRHIWIIYGVGDSSVGLKGKMYQENQVKLSGATPTLMVLRHFHCSHNGLTPSP